MAVATFDWAVWSVLFPKLVAAGVTEQQATAIFDYQTGLYLNNTDASAICDVTQRQSILYLIVAHLAALSGPNSSGLVGRVNRVREGSVDVGTEYKGTTNSAWWDQTPYGAQAYQAMAAYRTARYVAAPQTPPPDGFPYFGYGFAGPWL